MATIPENFSETRFRRQVPIRHYIVDFAIHWEKLVIESDGCQLGGKDYRVRTAVIEAEGYRLIRFWNNDVFGNSDGVVTVIAGVLLQHHPQPTLPHQGGGL